MRRLIPILLLCLLLTACGQATPTPTPEPTAAPTPEATIEPIAAETEAAGMSGFDFGESAALPALSSSEAAEKVRSDGEAVYLFATNVGKGDALVLRCGDWIGLIDTGKTWARGRVDQALAVMGSSFRAEDSYRLDAVFLTHTDDDHVGGLKWMTVHDGRIPNRAIEALYASALYTGVKEGKHPAVQAMGGAQWLKRGDEVPLGDSGAVLKVLAPASKYTDKDDNNSLVMMLESPQGRILLAGDMELPEEAELLNQGDDLSCAVLKVPNHGDDDTTSAQFANACAAQIAVVSTDSQQKPGTPDPGVVSRLEAAGSQVVVTEDSGLGILVTLKNGVATAEAVDFPYPAVSGLSIARVDASDDTITLQNTSDKAIGLLGMYLYSDKGNEMYVFADESLDPGATLTVGTNSTEGDYDLLWDDKKVINKKKTDTIYLDDNCGRLIDWMGNGK